MDREKLLLKNYLVYIQGKNYYTIILQNAILSLHTVSASKILRSFRRVMGIQREVNLISLGENKEQKLNTSKVICNVKKIATNIKDT